MVAIYNSLAQKYQYFSDNKERKVTCVLHCSVYVMVLHCLRMYPI